MAFSGIRVHYAVARPAGDVKNRVLLLSSPMINSFHWRKVVPELQDLGCLCALVDLPGFGQSDPRAPQSDGQRASMVWGVLDEVDAADGQPMSLWHLAAHGSACGTILRMAALYPDSVKSQIHICPVFAAPARDADAPERFYDAHIPDPQRFKALIERWSGYPMDDYIVDRMRRPLMRPGSRQTFSRMLKYAATPPRRGMGFCPTMALLGGLDPLADSRAMAQVDALLPDAETHTLRLAGHFPMETHSRALRDYLRGWLRFNDGE